MSPTLQGVLKDGFGEAVVVCDMPEPCKFLSLDNCQKRSLWTHKEVDLAPQPVVGLVFQVGGTEKFLHTFWFRKPGFFFQSQQSPCFAAVKEDGGDKRLPELERACKADAVAPPVPD